MEKNRTTGSVLGNLIAFSLPYLLSYFLQTLYGMADLYITGQFYDTAEITAVSIGSQVMHMLTVVIVGLAMGTTVTIAKAVGAGNRSQTSYIIGNTATLFLIVSVGMTLVLLCFVRPIVSVMATPAEAATGTVRYLTICFLGIPFITAYNCISAIFRGLGDSKIPMYFIAIACVTNILLDYLLIGGMQLGAAGAALGTTISQGVSVLLALAVLCKQRHALDLQRGCFRMQAAVLKPIVKIGVPIALQDGLIQVAFLIITIIANQRSLTDAAVVGIVEKVICFVFLIPSSMMSAVSALAAQNIGAGKHTRASATLRYALLICVGFGLTVAGLVQFSAESIVGLFDDSAAVMTAGGQYLRGYIWDCVFAGIHFCFTGYFCAYGKSALSFLHNILSIVLVRVPGAYFMSKWYPDTLLPMGCAAAAGSLLSVVICSIAMLWMRRTLGAKFSRKSA